MVELLTSLVLALTHAPAVQVQCEFPPSQIHSTDIGLAAPPPPVAYIYLRPFVCKSIARHEHFGLMVLAHEVLHVRHDPWCQAHGVTFDACHVWIHRWDDWYAENVVRWKLLALSR